MVTDEESEAVRVSARSLDAQAPDLQPIFLYIDKTLRERFVEFGIYGYEITVDAHITLAEARKAIEQDFGGSSHAALCLKLAGENEAEVRDYGETVGAFCSRQVSLPCTLHAGLRFNPFPISRKTYRTRESIDNFNEQDFMYKFPPVPVNGFNQQVIRSDVLGAWVDGEPYRTSESTEEFSENDVVSEFPFVVPVNGLNRK